MSTHNIGFHADIRKIFTYHLFLSGAMLVNSAKLQIKGVVQDKPFLWTQRY